MKESVTEIYTLMSSSPSKQEKGRIKKAFDFAEKRHSGQKRFSGEDYFTHVLETAKNLARFGMDTETIVAGLLHDVIEDGKATREEVEKEFGKEILFLVEGVTKLGTLKYRGVERHIESLRKLFIAMSEDIRVLIIKLVDRLHNMKTLEHVPKEEKRRRIALETLEIYAPLSERLSIGALQKELQDLSFRFLHPEKYEQIKKVVEEKKDAYIKILEKLSKSIKKTLSKEKIKILKSDYRVKGLYSLYKKLERGRELENTYDIMALRFIVPTVNDCYKVLGLIHGKWRPLPGRIKDYIASPKLNGYQSLHTTIFTGEGDIVEIQIRTMKMHREAELGAAAHADYKSSDKNNKIWLKRIFENLGSFSSKNDDEEKGSEKIPSWIKKMREYQADLEKPREFMSSLKTDLLSNRVFVFTPDGDVIDLPEGSGPIDFAYMIHSDIGNHMTGAKINGKLSSMENSLNNGDIVEIITRKSASPTAKWLKMAKTNNAKRFIKNYLSKER